MTSPYEDGLDRTPANFQPLTPLTFLDRAAHTWPDHPAIIHGRLRRGYGEFSARARRLASVLTQGGIGPGDTVSAMLSNTPEMLEAHHGVPMTGAVLNTINTRLDAAIIAFILDHAEAKVLITDTEFSATVRQALAQAKVRPLVVDVVDRECEVRGSVSARASTRNGPRKVTRNFIPISRTTNGRRSRSTTHPAPPATPRVSSITTAALTDGVCGTRSLPMGHHPVYLWTLPMFHCNGWCFPWTLGVTGGTHVCLRSVRAKAIYDAIAEHGVTHLCGAPIVMATLLNAAESDKRAFLHPVRFVTAAAPPPEAVLAGMEDAGFRVTHVYGLTETYGPAVVNEWHRDWDGLPNAERAARKARQGVRYPALEDLAVLDPHRLEPVPADGKTIGEIMFRGNIVMKGYLKNPKATSEAFAGGWFHSGDLGVNHRDGYIQLKDRSKDIIISGGENISSIEVEDALYKHPCVGAAAVVAKPDEKWGETPCAFVELKAKATVTEAELIAFCRDQLAHYKCPHRIVFTDLPRTSTGKIQKFKLRELAKTV